jgi:WD40 repeat protein
VLAWVAKDGTVSIWDTTKAEAESFSGPSQAIALAFQPRHYRLAVCRSDHVIELWDVGSAKMLHSFSCPGCLAPIAFSPRGDLLAVASDDHSILVLRTDSWKEVLRLRGHAASVGGLAFHPDGERLASASTDHMVKLWDMVTGQEILTLDEHTFRVSSVVFSADGRFLASAGDDWTVRIRDAGPLTPELLDERQALSLLAFLFDKDKSLDAMEAGIKSAAVSEGVRQKALDLMKPFVESQLPRKKPK